MTVYTVHNSAELTSTFSLAGDGDTIELTAGNYGATMLRGQHFAQGITITSQDPNARAVFTDTLNLLNTSGVTIEGVDVIAAKLAAGGKVARVGISSSSDISLSDVHIQGHIPTASEGANPLLTSTQRSQPIAGYGYETGLRISSSQDVTVKNIELSDLRGGVSLSDVKDSTITAIDLHDIREGIDLNDIQNLVIEQSQIHDLKPWQLPNGIGDHPDMIQYWGVNSSYGIDGLTIRDNFFYQPAGTKTQTIFGGMHLGQTGLSASNFTITDNVIINAQTNAIRLHDVDGVNISGNVLLPNEDNLSFRSYPSIYLGNVSNAVVADNTMMPRYQTGTGLNLSASQLQAAHIVTSGNVIMSNTPSSPVYWHTVLDDVLAQLGTQIGSGTGSSSGGSGSSSSGASGGAPTAILDPGDVPAGDVRTILTGDDNKNTLTADSKGSYLFGFDQDDTLKSGTGHDYMVGGAGADTFHFVHYGSTAPQIDVIADLDFVEGDQIMLRGDMVPAIDDSVDPLNNIVIFAKSGVAYFDSIADISEAVDGGALVARAIAFDLMLS